ncbi:MAG: hypothetical protein V4465_00545, partial [Patescibacteria group bacterium]
GKVEPRLALNLGDGRYFLFKNNTQPIAVSSSEEEVRAETDLRMKALSKLNPSERAALGL